MTPDDLERTAAETAVSAVLSVQHDDCLAYWGIEDGAMHARAARLGLKMMRAPMRDFDVGDQRCNLPPPGNGVRLETGSDPIFPDPASKRGLTPFFRTPFLSILVGGPAKKRRH